MTTWPYRKHWWGYTNFGPTQIPPAPKYLVYTDRTTGAYWWLIMDQTSDPTSDGFGYIGFVSVPPWPLGNNPTSSAGVLPPYDPGAWPSGPYFGNTLVIPANEEPWLNMAPIDAANGETPFIVGMKQRLFISAGAPAIELFQNNPQLGDVKDGQERVIATNVTGNVGFGIYYAELILSASAPGWAWTPIKVIQTSNPAPYLPQNDFPSQQVDD